METAFRNYGLGADEVDLIVATDSEGILGVGDWGWAASRSRTETGVYTARRYLHPRRVIPVVLDTGTDNPTCWRGHVPGQYTAGQGEQYDQLIDAYVSTATRLSRNAMLHWEDFGAANARRILLSTPGPAARSTTTSRAPPRWCWPPTLCATRRGHGNARSDGGHPRSPEAPPGIRIADSLRQVMIDEGLSSDQATARSTRTGQQGPADQRLPGTLRDFRVPYAPDGRRGRRLARTRTAGSAWPVVTRSRHHADQDLDPARGVHRQIVTATGLARRTAHHHAPVNPPSHSEAQAADLIAWTGGRALIATGSPSRP